MPATRRGAVAGIGAAAGGHQPVRPGWTCRACHSPWPCPGQRARYQAEYSTSRQSLGLLMGGHYTDAIIDQPTWPAGPLYDRFLGWIRQHPPTQTGPMTGDADAEGLAG